mgnify:FL=1
MAKYISKRLLQAIFVLLGVSLVAFIILHLSGDPLSLLISSGATPEQEAAIRTKMGLDDPLYIQYFRFLAQILHGDFGESLYYKQSTLSLIMNRLPATIQLTFAGILVAIVIGIPFGIIAATKKGSVVDSVVRIIAICGQAIPSFWLGLMMILIFSVKLKWLPTSGRGTFAQMIMPAITVGLFSMASVCRLTRSTMIETLKTDYIRTAKAKGLHKARIIVVHALRNSLLPVVTTIGMEIGHLLGGTLLTETIFSWPGIGSLAVQAITNRDYPLVQTAVLITAFMFVIVNLIVDLLYAVIDPRIDVTNAKLE